LIRQVILDSIPTHFPKHGRLLGRRWQHWKKEIARERDRANRALP